jgi:aminoglycoside 2''-phosphotransferase
MPKPYTNTREAAILAALAGRLPLPIPVSKLVPVSGSTVAVHNKLPGEPLLSLAGFSDAERERLAADLADFLRALHTLPNAILRPGAHERDPFTEWVDLLRHLEAIVFPLLADDLAAAITRRFDRFLAVTPHLSTTIIHGDFGTGNILIENRRASGIIDFSGCGPGDPAYDFASLAAGLGDSFLRLMQQHYAGIATMTGRIAFYRSSFSLLDVLAGIEHDDSQALQAGLGALNHEQV